MNVTPEVNPPFDEHAAVPVSRITPPQDFLDPSVITYSELTAWLAGAPGSITYSNVEGRLTPWLRAAAQRMDPVENLKQSAISFYLQGVVTRTPPDTVEGATALADLAVSGRASYGQFRNHVPQESDLVNDVRTRLTAWQNPPDENRLVASVRRALDRAYSVAWALRDPNPVTRGQSRALLGWLAVSGEDDPPDRPVNLDSAPYAQFDLPVTCQGVTVETRYMIALSEPGNLPAPSSPPIRQAPPTPAPSIPADHEVILFLHGHSSRAEESADLVIPLLQATSQLGRKVAIVAFDLPSNGYSQMIDHLSVAPSNATMFTSIPFGGPPTYPLLDFLVQFVISFVDALDMQVSIKNRVAAVIGGSLGGNLCLRLGERNDQSWIRNLVAWSPASVWSTFDHDMVKWGALQACQGRMNESETDAPSGPSRIRFLYEAFDSPTGPGTPPQPQQWYRDGWGAKDAYIQADREERREIYNPLFRRWHWRVALEQLLFSHLNTDTPDGRPRYASNATNTLLASGKLDDFNWANIYPRTHDLAGLMTQTPGTSLFLLNTGHSIHNERPIFLAQQIAQFLGPELKTMKIHVTPTPTPLNTPIPNLMVSAVDALTNAVLVQGTVTLHNYESVAGGQSEWTSHVFPTNTPASHVVTLHSETTQVAGRRGPPMTINPSITVSAPGYAPASQPLG